MDGTPDLYGEEAAPATITSMLREVQIVKGRSYAVNFDPHTARFESRTPILVSGGGPEDYVYTPPIAGQGDITGRASDEQERQVVLLEREDKARASTACIQHPKMRLEEKADQPGSSSDHDAKVSKQSFAIRRAGVTVMIDENGAVVIDAKDSTTPIVRVQLPDNGKLRISRNGSAGGHPVLWHKLEKWVSDGFDPPGELVEAVTLLDWALNMTRRLIVAEENVAYIRDALLLPTTGADPIITAAEAAELLDWSEESGEPDLEFPTFPNMAGVAIDMSKDVG